MAASAPQPQPPLRILIVDDHVDSARALARLFRSDGHLVITAHSMAGALALLVGQQPVSVVVSDISLPDGDGCDLLRRLRALYGGRDVPAVAITGHGDEGWIDECRLAGYRAFLTKPVLFEQVAEAIRAARAADALPTAATTPVSAAAQPLGGVPAPLPDG